MYQLRLKYPKSARRLSVAPRVFPGVCPRLLDFFTLEFPIHGCPCFSGGKMYPCLAAQTQKYQLLVWKWLVTVLMACLFRILQC